jgi:hypothetical protein
MGICNEFSRSLLARGEASAIINPRKIPPDEFESYVLQFARINRRQLISGAESDDFKVEFYRESKPDGTMMILGTVASRWLEGMRKQLNASFSLIASIEWAASQDAGNGTPAPSCPSCKGIKPDDRLAGSFVREAWDHRRGCQLKIILDALRPRYLEIV